MEGNHSKFLVFILVFIMISSVAGLDVIEPSEDRGERDGGPTEPDVIPSRWMDPYGTVDMEHQTYTSARQDIEVRSSVSTDDSRGRVALIVDDDLYREIEDEMDRHIDYLTADDLDVILITFSGTAEDLRSLLSDLHDEKDSLFGAKLIGDLPYIIYEMYQDWGSGTEYETFPNDLFFMDLDGTWEDTEGNGYYDTWSGDRHLDIWVSRMKADNLVSLGSESDLMISYFDKNHAYRSGELRPQQDALAYVDNDWENMGPDDQTNLEMIYGNNVTMENDPSRTTVQDYINNRMPVDQEMIFTRSHGWPGGHGYNQGGSYDYVFCSDYRNIKPPALFYHLFVCSGVDYTYDDYLGGTVIFNHDDSGLTSWGSTKTGGMLYDQFFYTPLSNGEDIGQSFIDWFNVVKNYGDWTHRWFWGMTIIGDGTLRPSPFFEPTEITDSFSIELSSENEGWNFVSFNIDATDPCLESILEDEDNGISGSYDRLIYFNASAQSWQSYVPYREEHYNDLEGWDLRMGIWIKMNNEDTLVIKGTEPVETRIDLYPGWNMVGYPSHEPGEGLPTEIDKIGYFSPGEPYHIVYDHEPEGFTFEPGNGYWIHNPTDNVLLWSVTYEER